MLNDVVKIRSPIDCDEPVFLPFFEGKEDKLNILNIEYSQVE